GEVIKLKLFTPINDVYTFEGELTNFKSNTVELLQNNDLIINIDLNNVKKAKVQYDKFKQKVK
ncbi:hypothetical protein OAQ05_03115, partial [Acidimicrobiia bacterium]|nr:hypothetical protein [Acidimicrobiia bacterium]